MVAQNKIVVAKQSISPRRKPPFKKFRHPEQAELVSAPLKDL